MAVSREIGQGCRLKLRARNQRKVGRGRQKIAKTFVIHVEEGAVLDDWTVNTCRPLIEVIEWGGLARRVAEELVRVQRAPIPHSEILGRIRRCE